MNISEDIELLVNNKEEEIRKIFYTKINKLNESINEKDKMIQNLVDKLEKLKNDFDFNYNLIEERDNDLKIYEEKIDSFILLLNDKDEEITIFKKQIEELNLKLQNEKNKRENNEELLKFNLSKVNIQHKEEIKKLNAIIEKLKEEIKIMKEENKLKMDEMNYTYENEKRKFTDEIHHLQNQFKRSKELNDKEEKFKKKIEDLQISLAKINTENLNLIKEKIHTENKLKLYEANDNETKTNNFVIQEKNKYLVKEIEELKAELSSRQHKVENLNKIVDEYSTDIHNLKQKIQLKDFEIERKVMSEKILNEKLRDCNYIIDKLTEEKRTLIRDNEEDKIKLQSYESKNKLQNDEIYNLKSTNEKHSEELKKLKEESQTLKSENETLKKKVKELLNLNDQLKESKENNNNNSSMIVDFFNPSNKKKMSISKEVMNGNNFENTLKEKDQEIERLNKELEGAKMILVRVESEMAQTYNQFKENENKYIDKINKLELELIRKDLELKNSLNISHIDSKLKEKENSSELNEIISSQKKEIQKRNEEINKIKEILNLKVNEINRIKKERDKLAQLSCSLRAEVNRLENINLGNYHMSNNLDQQEYQDFEMPLSNTSVISNAHSYTNNIPDYEEFRKKKSTILTKGESDRVLKEEAKKHIENAMSRADARDTSVKSNGNLVKSPNLRKVQIDKVSRNNSRSKSKSPRSTSIERGRKYESNTNLLDAVTITNQSSNGLKLLKRDRNRNLNENY